MEKLFPALRDIVASHNKTTLWLGVILVVLGAAGGVGYNSVLPIAKTWAQVSLMVAGGVLVALSYAQQSSETSLDPDKFVELGIKIIAPQPNERVTSRTRVTVVSEQPLPKGYELQVLRGYPRQKGVVPNSKAHKTAGKLEWIAHDFDIGGAPKELRTIEVWLVGSNGAALLANWEENHAIVAKANRELRRLGELAKQQPAIDWLPPITRLTSDMARCQSVLVERAP